MLQNKMNLSFSVLPQPFAVAKLPADASVPAHILSANGFVTISRTADELSIVCPASFVEEGMRAEYGWRLLKIHGPFSFDQVGILVSLLQPLAAASVGIFAISTFDTDYILVKSEKLQLALNSLQIAGHKLIDSIGITDE